MTVLLGSTSATTSGTDNSALQAIVATREVAATDGTVDTISVQFASTNTYTSGIVAAIYDATGTSGGPGARVGSQVAITVGTNGATRYVTSAPGAAATVTSGQTYWIAVLSTPGTGSWIWGNATGNNGAGGTANGLVATGTGFTSLPATFPAFSFVAETMNTYAEGTSSAVVVSFIPRRMPLGV